MMITGFGLIFFIVLFLGELVGYAVFCDMLGVKFFKNKEFSSPQIFTYIGIAIVFIAMFCIICWNTVTFDNDLKYSWQYNIYALEDNTVTTISRSQRNYIIEQNMEYFHMADYKDGKKMYSVNKNKSYIVENASVQPHIEIFEAVPKRKTFFASWFITSQQIEYKIVVPVKTVTTNFNVDMKN